MKTMLAVLAGVFFLSIGMIGAQDAPLNVIATTTIVADVAQNVAGDLFTVQSLLPPNSDTHAYEPTIDDARRIAGADLILAVGAGYEGFLTSLIENVGENIPVVTVNNGLEIRSLGLDEHGYEGEENHEHEHEEIADLSPWAGDFMSGYSVGIEAMQPAIDAILASTPELTSDDLIRYWDEGNATSFNGMSFAGDTVTFTLPNGNNATCTYTFSGSAPIPDLEGAIWSIFETSDLACADYRVLLLNPMHTSEAGAIPHFHMRYSSGSTEEVIADSSPWYPSIYPASTTAEDILPMWTASARQIGLFIASMYGIDVVLTEEEQAATVTSDTHDHEARQTLGILGDGLACDVHAHDEDEAPEDEHEHGGCDPHTWMDPTYVIGWVNNIVEALSAADPANADTYRANGDAYIAELEALDAEIAELVNQLAAEQRMLITNHEFLNYFADRYGFEVAGTVLPGVSTGGEPDPRSMAALIELIRTEGVPAIFAEVSANPQLAETIAQEAGVQVITNLYSESLSDATGDAPTYLEFMRHNAQTIVNALAGS